MRRPRRAPFAKRRPGTFALPAPKWKTVLSILVGLSGAMNASAQERAVASGASLDVHGRAEAEYRADDSALASLAGGGLVGRSELRYWDASKTEAGYTLFAARGRSYLIDMEGYVVRTWSIGTNPRFLDYNGHLLDATKDDPSGFQGFRELDWDGNTVWEYQETRDGYAPHHDWVRIFNPELGQYTTLYIANRTITHEQAIAAGADPANGPYAGSQMDAIVEIDMQGNVIWEWWFFDHVIQDVDPLKPNYVGTGKSVSDYPGRIDINLPGRPLRKDWLHCNSLDYNDELDQIVVNSVQGEFYVIDHAKTFVPGSPAQSLALAAGPDGDFLYRFGDPARYGQGDPPSILEDWTQSTSGNKQIGASHDIHWIRPGLPGAGHFLVFNNGQYLFERTAQSYVFEIDGFRDAGGNDTGSYVNPPDAGYYTWELPKDTHKAKKLMSNQITWIYYSKNNQSFFSHIGSGAQRLPNGNTLICAMTEGHLFEVTSDGDVVWEYYNPVTNDGILEVLHDEYPMYNAVFRAYRYTRDHAALAGRDLTPGSTITGRTPEYLTPDSESSEANPGTSDLPTETTLLPAYPNPFNPSTVIPFRLATGGYVRLTVHDALGRVVRTLVSQVRSRGEYEVAWDGRSDTGRQVPSGTYFTVLDGAASRSTRSLVVAR